MFNSTHTLVGLAIARMGFDRWTKHATATAVIAANLPDIDIVAQLAGTTSYIEYHRGITHSFIGVPLLSLLLTLVLWRFTGNAARTFLIALIAMLTHPLFDYANSYGLRPFLPWNGMWYYGDSLFIIDPYLDFILLSTVVLSSRSSTRRRWLAIAGLCVVTSYIGARILLRDLAESELARYVADVPGYQKSAVAPPVFNPFIWTGIIETDDAVSSIAIDVFRGTPYELTRLEKGKPSTVTARAMDTHAAEVFYDFARFPLVRVQDLERGYSVVFADFRFYRQTAGTAFGARIVLDNSLRVVSESMGFTQSVID